MKKQWNKHSNVFSFSFFPLLGTVCNCNASLCSLYTLSGLEFSCAQRNWKRTHFLESTVLNLKLCAVCNASGLFFRRVHSLRRPWLPLLSGPHHDADCAVDGRTRGLCVLDFSQPRSKNAQSAIGQNGNAASFNEADTSSQETSLYLDFGISPVHVFLYH